jgi:hypothetical protein
MRARVGLAVSRDAVRAVALRDERVVWAGEAPLGSPDELPQTIDRLLDQASLPRWPRPLLSAAVGPHCAQVKRLAGLPETSDAATLASIIRESVGTFFLKNGITLVTTGVRPVGAGSAVAAAIEQSCVDAIHAACRARGLRAGPIAPTAVALTRATADAAFQWNDGSLTVEVRHTDAGVESVRTRPAQSADGSPPLTPVPGLATLGADAVRYADAYGAAALDALEPLAVHAVVSPWLTLVQSRRPLAVGGALLALALVSVALSPLAAVWAGKRATARLEQVRPGRWQVISGALTQLDGVSGLLRDAQAFADARASASRLLGELTRVLPEGTALLSFDWTADRGEAVVLTPNAGATLAAMRRLPGVSAAELVGSVSNQSAGGRELQRVTVRFTMTPTTTTAARR